MITGEDIRSIFVELQGPRSIDAALHKSLQIVCGAVEASAAGLRIDPDTESDKGWWVVHDPQSLLLNADMGTAFSGTDHSVPRPTAMRLPPGDRSKVNVALTSDGRPIGLLCLTISDNRDAKTLAHSIEPMSSVLATLLCAAVASRTGPNGLVNYFDLRSRIESELARAERTQADVTVLHIDWRASLPSSVFHDAQPLSTANRLCDFLLSQLRRSDTVGLIAPDHVVALLPETGPVGAMIAQRRIEHSLLTLGEHTQWEDELRITARVFPAQDSNIEALLAVDDWQPQRAEPTTC